MTGRRTCGLVVVVAAGGALLLPADVGAARGAGQVAVTVERTRISTQLGQKFVLRSTVANRGSTAASGLIAHLNILSLRNGVYVDPEDWSSQRTRYLRPIPAGGSSTTTWRMQAVSAGTFGVYVAVLPANAAARVPATGPTVELAVAERKTLNSGGILPLALGVPGGLALLAAGLRLRTRR
jgi:hypothetical protein